MAASKDPNSSCNSGEVVVNHWDWQVEPDFAAEKLCCSITLRVAALEDGVTSLVLDVCDLNVSSVVNTDSGESLQFEIQSPKGAFGSTLCITLPSTCAKKGAELKVTVQYETSPSCTAVQWLKPAQTAGKVHPYLYTQCQPINARSMLPCQDTPSVKTTYSAEVTVPSELTALMSGERLVSEPHPTKAGKMVFRFRQEIPIPSYLVALVVGALESRKIGPRSHVWSEKEVVDQAAWEFEETERMLQAAEEIVGRYIWGQYDLLVLPPSFPYGGMENPCLTFVSPTLLAGDRSLANVVAHEVSHSWTGNLVTNITWEEFWLNEGITTYLERKIVGKLHGEQERHLHAMDGWKGLIDATDRFKRDNKYLLTALVPRLIGVHPEDAFSAIPYEKGSAFLFYLETLLGGPGTLDEFLKSYVEKFKFGTISSEVWKQYFLEYFHQEVSEGMFDSVEWEKWLYAPGMPPYTPKYDTTLADASAALADKWTTVELTDSGLSQFSANDIAQMTSRAVQEFLNQLLAKPPLPVEVLQAMDKVYGLGKWENAEIKFRWLKLCLRSKWKDVFPLVTDFITKQGRMKFVRPLYKDLFCCERDGRDLAVATYKRSKDFYHSVAATQIAKDLELN